MTPSSTDPDEVRELQNAFGTIRARESQLREDRRLAELSLEVVRSLGNTSEHQSVLRTVAESWTTDPNITLAVATLLVEQSARRGMDEPIIRDETPAAWAARALEASLSSLDAESANDASVAGNLQATLANALRLCGPGHDAEARQASERALELDDSQASWWSDAGLLHKWRGRFREGMRAIEAARERGAPSKPSLWNLAICATGCGEGEVATRAWRELSLPATSDPSTEMPIVEGLPPLMVRVLSRPSPTDGTTEFREGVGFELVWVAPLSPCHGVVQSPTFRDAPIDYGDLVLWDGAPVAQHTLASGERVPVFPLLEILHRGDERRWPFVGIERKAGALERLRTTLPEGARLFVQEERTVQHCASCEAGVPHEHAEADESRSDPNADARRFLRGKVVLGASVELPAFQQIWEASLSGQAWVASLPALYEALHETKRAGQEHQTWRGIERKWLAERTSA
ncbi:MAG: hypothetical protein AAF500_17915 [Myxococcota bacterium]